MKNILKVICIAAATLDIIFYIAYLHQQGSMPAYFEAKFTAECTADCKSGSPNSRYTGLNYTDKCLDLNLGLKNQFDSTCAAIPYQCLCASDYGTFQAPDLLKDDPDLHWIDRYNLSNNVNTALFLLSGAGYLILNRYGKKEI